MAAFAIRDARLLDLPSLRDLFRRSSLSNDGDRASLLANPEALELSDIAVSDGRTRLAEDPDGRIAGFVTTDVAGGVLEIEDLFVAPERMRHGVGRALILDAVATARQRAATRLEVTANGHAIRFYNKVGFLSDDIVETQFGPGYRMHLDVPGGGAPAT